MKLFLTLIVSLALIGCSSTSKENKYYSLNLIDEIVEGSASDKDIIIIKPIQLAPFLNVQGLVMQLGKHQIVTANHHLWAAPLQQTLAKILQQNLNKNCTDYNFEISTHYLKHDSGMSLQLEFDKFHATNESTIIVAGRFWVLKSAVPNGTSNRFSLTDSLNQDGYLHVVEKLSASMTDVSKTICNGIKENTMIKD